MRCADLLADAERAGRLTPEFQDRMGQALLALCEDADVVLLTCSTLGLAAQAVAEAAPVPVLRVDAAFAAEAVRDGGKVVALCAVEATLGPTRAVFEEAAHATGAGVEVRLVPGAWAAFKAGEQDRYFALIVAAADAAARDGATRVALAQASMAGAAGLCQVAPPPLEQPGGRARGSRKRRREPARPGIVAGNGSTPVRLRAHANICERTGGERASICDQGCPSNKAQPRTPRLSANPGHTGKRTR